MRLVVTGGGTGGHIYPALAVAKEMAALEPKSVLCYIGTERGMERGLAKKEGLDFCAVRSSGIMGKSPLVAARGVANASLGVSDAFGVLRKFRPDAVFGTGGYVSGPVLLASWMLRIPRAIQEQNAVPGKTNQVLSRLAHRIFCAFEYTRRFFPDDSKVLVTGNPVRKALFEPSKEEGRGFFGIVTESPVILILGGSLGAKTLVEAGMQLAAEGSKGVAIILVTGAKYYSWAAEKLGVSLRGGIEGASFGNIIIRPYIHEMSMAYAAADVVVGRAGGMTLSEITALGIPSVVIPSPNVANNEQEYNARALEEAGAAVIVREGRETPFRVAEAALSLALCEEKRRGIGESAQKMGKPDAALNICKELVTLVGSRF